MLYCTVYALGELSCLYPIAGSFSAFATRFLDPAWGFAMGWNYALQWMVTLPLEIVAAAITIEYWDSPVSPALWVTIFLVLVITINLFGVEGFGEAEFYFSMVKVVAIVGFMYDFHILSTNTKLLEEQWLNRNSILGIILDCGGGPKGEYIGGKNWHHPGAFHNGFKGLCSVFVTAAFAFSGTELVGLAAAETENPRKSLPKAVKQVFWRISLVSTPISSKQRNKKMSSHPITTVLPDILNPHRPPRPLQRPPPPQRHHLRRRQSLPLRPRHNERHHPRPPLHLQRRDNNRRPQRRQLRHLRLLTHPRRPCRAEPSPKMPRVHRSERTTSHLHPRHQRRRSDRLHCRLGRGLFR